MRYVVTALWLYRVEAAVIFREALDLPGDIGEDITRDAIDRLGTSVHQTRLYGKVDYKRARHIFLPEHLIHQALFLDSKAEKDKNTATIQTTQTSLRIRYVDPHGATIDVPGEVPKVVRTATAELQHRRPVALVGLGGLLPDGGGPGLSAPWAQQRSATGSEHGPAAAGPRRSSPLGLGALVAPPPPRCCRCVRSRRTARFAGWPAGG